MRHLTPALPALLLAAALALPARADRAAAEAAARDGQAAMQRKDMKAAVEAFTRALDADRGWGTAWGWRGLAKYRDADFTGAIEDFGHAVELDPGTVDWPLHRIQTYLYLDRIPEALEATEAALKARPDDALTLSLRGRALVRAGDVDGGLQLQDRAFEKGGRDVQLPPRADAYMRRADWETLLRTSEEALAGGAPSTNFYYFRVIANSELGRADAAAAAAGELEKRAGQNITWIMCRTWIAATPGAKFNAAEARDGAARLLESANPECLNTAARALFHSGDPGRCADVLIARARHMNFDTLFWLGAALWKQGKLPEARVVLGDARRLNPHLSRHAPRVPGIADFLASIDRDLGRDDAANADRRRLGQELATHLLTVAEIEALVRQYRFAAAVAEYGRLRQAVASEARRAEIDARLPEIQGMAGAHAKLAAGINAGKLKLKTHVAGLELAVTRAEDAVFRFTIPKGEGRFPWAFLGPAAYVELALAAVPSPEEAFGLGCLAWDSGDRVLAAKLWSEALKKKPALRAGTDAFIARRRGVPPPAGGFVLFRGAYVTPEEKANLEKGLVLFQGEWVSAKDKEELARGRVRVEGQWVPGDEAELLRRGCRKVDGRWLGPEEVEELRSKWETAWTQETEHVSIRTNEGESFAKELAGLAEAAWGAFREFHGAEPKLGSGQKLAIWAFRDYEDYRRHCVETKAEAYLAAAGFARSDSLTVVAWNKTRNRQQFLQTCVHEAAHGFYDHAFPGHKAASWYAEGTATYFEGFSWEGKSWKFGVPSESRLAMAREAVKAGRNLTIAELVKGDAIGLINSDSGKALQFYAEAWSLHYFLARTENRKTREAFAEYRKAVAAGRAEALESFFPEMAQLEADWKRFVGGL